MRGPIARLFDLILPFKDNPLKRYLINAKPWGKWVQVVSKPCIF